MNVMQSQAWLPVRKVPHHFLSCMSHKSWTAANHPQARHGATEVSFISRSAFELFLFHILHKFLIINSAAAARTDLIYNVSVHYSDQKATPAPVTLGFSFPVSSHIWRTQPGPGEDEMMDRFPPRVLQK